MFCLADTSEVTFFFCFMLRGKGRMRPDYCLGPHLRQMLLYGCTRLEIGVQSTYEDVACDTNRGHTVAAVADCFCLAKDADMDFVICISNVLHYKSCNIYLGRGLRIIYGFVTSN